MEDFQEALGGPAFPGGGPWGPAGLLHPPDLPVPERQDHNRAGKKNQRAAAPADSANRAPRHPRTHRSKKPSNRS
jgi:hypothetical protein